MKRLATWVFYCVGALAIGYLALYAYAIFTGRDLVARRSHPYFSQAGCAELFSAYLNLIASVSEVNPRLRLWRYGLLTNFAPLAKEC